MLLLTAKVPFDQIGGVAFWMSILIVTIVILVVLAWPRRRGPHDDD